MSFDNRKWCSGDILAQTPISGSGSLDDAVLGETLLERSLISETSQPDSVDGADCMTEDFDDNVFDNSDATVSGSMGKEPKENRKKSDGEILYCYIKLHTT